MCEPAPFPVRRVDEQLPRMEALLDPSLMKPVFEQHVLDGAKVRACRILQVRYKPGRNCLVSYSAIIRDRAGCEHEQILYARAYESGGSLSRFHKAQSQKLVQSAFGKSLVHLPELETIIWVFPNDRKLGALPSLLDTAVLRDQALPAVISAGFGDQWKIAKLAREIVHYVAEHTCTVRVTVQLRDAVTGEERFTILYGKTYYDEEGAETYRRMTVLWNSAARFQGALRIARPLAYQPDTRTLWQLGVDGTALYEYDWRSESSIALLTQAAHALASLHGSSIKGLPPAPTELLLSRLKQAEDVIGRAYPEYRETVAALAGQLIRQAHGLSLRPAATLHGDLHLKNFLVLGDGVALIDFDNLRSGDPLQDLGSFLAALYYRGLVDSTSEAETRHLADRFVQAYAERVPWSVPERDLRWHVAAALVSERAFRCVTRLKTAGGASLQAILALADRFLQAANQNQCEPPALMNEFAGLTDTERMKAVFNERLPALLRYEVKVMGCRLGDVHYKTYLKPKSWRKAFVGVSYHLQLSNSPAPCIAYAKVLPKVRSEEESGNAGGQPDAYWPDLRLMLWVFPNDPAMPWLRQAIEPDRVYKHLPCEPVPGNLCVEVLNYRPEIRCTTRYRMRDRSLTLYGKTYADDRGREISRRLSDLWELCQAVQTGFLIPQPLGYCEAIRTIWQKELPGTPLAGVIAPENHRHFLDDSIRRLVFFHRSGIKSPMRMTLREQLEDLTKKMIRLSQAFPAAAPLAQSIVESLGQSLPELTPIPPLLVHGDFHLRQLLVHNGRVALFDFDESSYGDPIEDLGYFIADLHHYTFDPRFVDAMAEVLVDAYSRQIGSPVPGERLAWHLGVQFATRAYRAYLQLKPNLSALVHFYLERAREALVRAEVQV